MNKGMWLGFFFFVALVLLGFGTLLVGHVTFFKKTTELRIHFNVVEGLRAGDDVRVEGIVVGKVSALKLNDNGGVDVIARLDEAIKLYEGYEIYVESFSVLGGTFISIKRGPMGTPVDLTNLQGKSRANAIDEVGGLAQENRQSFKELIVNLRDVTAAMKESRGSVGKLINETELHDEAVKLIQEGRKAVELLQQMAKTYDDALRTGQGAIGRLLNDRELADKMTKSAENIEKSTESLRKISEKIDRGEGALGAIINDKDLSDKLKKTVDNIEETSENLKNISGKAAKGEGTIGKLLQDDSLYDKANKTIEDIDKVIGRAARAQVWIASDVKFYPAGETIAKLGIRIEPDDTKYFYLGAAFIGLDAHSSVIDFDGKTDSGNLTLIKAEAALAYRIPWFLDKRLALRAGLLEGKPGGAVEFTWEDWGLFHHPVQFTFEGRTSYHSVDDERLNEFNPGAMLRFWIKTSIWQKGDQWWEKLLYAVKVYGGVNRIGHGPEYFAGIGLEWEDEDIRTLVSLLGLAK